MCNTLRGRKRREKEKEKKRKRKTGKPTIKWNHFEEEIE